MDTWELVAREQIRDTLARYNWSGDAGRVEALAQTFCADGVLEVRGMAPVHGRSGIATFLGNVAGGVASGVPDVKPVVRHILTNVLFTALAPQRAEVSSYFTVVTHVGLDHFGRYRDVLVPEDDTWLIKHRKVTTDWAAPESVMARS